MHAVIRCDQPPLSSKNSAETANKRKSAPPIIVTKINEISASMITGLLHLLNFLFVTFLKRLWI